MGNIFKGRNWEEVAEEKAKKIAKQVHGSEGLWELCLMEANSEMLRELQEAK